MFLDNLPIIWIVIAVILLGAEMLTGTFYLLVMGIAAAAGAIAAWAGAPLELQVALGIGIAGVGAFIVSRWHKNRHMRAKPADDNMEIGQIVVWEDSYPDGAWKVRYRGSQWQAQPASPQVDSAQTLIIVETRGNLLIVDNKFE